MILGLGIDSIEIERIECAAGNPRFLVRLFTPNEQQGWAARGKRPSTLAGLFAAKEAAIKALGGMQGYRWTDLEILWNPSGAPRLVLHAGAAQRLSRLGGTSAHVSITHDRTRAMAVVVLEGEGKAE